MPPAPDPYELVRGTELVGGDEGEEGEATIGEALLGCNLLLG